MTQLSEADVTRAFHGQPHKRIEVGTSSVAYWQFGSGPDVVLVHGWPLHSATFRRIIPRLAQNFTLHAFDLAGTGKTISDEGTSSHLLAHAELVKKVINSLDVKRYAVLAHDSGAAIARFAIAGDRRLAGLVMGNTEIPGHRPPGIAYAVGASKLPGFQTLAMMAMKSKWLRMSRYGFGTCFTDPSYAEGEFSKFFIEPFARPSVANGQLQLVKDFDIPLIDKLEVCHRDIAAPTLCIWGPGDPFFPIAKARRMLDQFAGGATLVEVPRAKLFAHEDHPDAFAKYAKKFLVDCFEKKTKVAAISSQS